MWTAAAEVTTCSGPGPADIWQVKVPPAVPWPIKDVPVLRIDQLKTPISYDPGELPGKIEKLLGIPREEVLECIILRQSVDARKKPELFQIYSVVVKVLREEAVLRKAEKNPRLKNQLRREELNRYSFPGGGSRSLEYPPVVVGMGPAGLFCAYELALHGYRPIVIERGRDVDRRTEDVERFWKEGVLDPDSNVQFGAGGAGTFSDGKLNTMVKDKDGRGRAALEIFAAFGADPAITYQAKPHIGTDVLRTVVKGMREEIIRLGGRVFFETCLTGGRIREDRICAAELSDGRVVDCEILVLATGHSARDTFRMLYDAGLPMEAKAFAVGLRAEHLQSEINLSQYGLADPGPLGPAPYKVTYQSPEGRGVFSFCMCPGGYVVNASSEEGGLAVNGMSYSGRGGRNANSAIVTTVSPEDYPGDHPLAGIEFQRDLERKAYALAKGRIPVQRLGIFRRCVEEDRSQEEILAEGHARPDAEGYVPGLAERQAGESLLPSLKGAYEWADVSSILPKGLNRAIAEGMAYFGRHIRGFDREDVILSGVESRTSSPVRILRDENLQSRVRGIYPAGEGAGYAGGITSAAMDGMRIAEAIAKVYAPFDVREK